MIKAQGIKNKLNMFSVGNWRKIREWGTKQSQRKSLPIGIIFLSYHPPYNLGASQVESQNWDESLYHISLETQTKPPLSPQITQPVLASIWVMANPFHGSEGSSNNDRETFKTFPSLITHDAVCLFYPLREVPLEVEILFLLMPPLTSSEVRNYKRELKFLLEDSLGVTDQLDQFLGPQIYT
jgi:hypothetical protein